METNPYNIIMNKLINEISPNDNKIEIIKFINDYNKYIIHLSLNNYPIKMITDFDEYCYFSSELILTENLNLNFITSLKKDAEYIISKLKNFKFKEEIVRNKVIEDKYHIHQKFESRTKFLINFNDLEKTSDIFRKTKALIDLSKFPKELLFNPNQIYQLLTNEIKHINENMSYTHYISLINNNPYDLSIKLKLTNKIMEELNNKCGYDYIEIKVSVDPHMYPFLPPKLEFIKPLIKPALVHNLMNLKILKIDNWNPTISLEWLIITLVEKLNPIIHDYIKFDESKNDELEIALAKLFALTKETTEKEIFNIEYNKIINNNTTKNTTWKAGIGYGSDIAQSNWNISSYIKDQELQNIKITELLECINNKIEKDSIKDIYNSNLPAFLINKIIGLTLLELNKCKTIHIEIINILNKLTKFDRNQDFINKIADAFTNISDDIKLLFQNNPEAQYDDDYIKIHCVADWYKSMKVEESIKPIKVIDLNDKMNYEVTMKKLQFGTNEILPSHMFHKNLNSKLDSKATMRIISEISSFKNGLPLNWDSTIWVRVSKKNIHLFSFYISGPKDTPYENGIFEFHAMFPSDYPNSEPKVLLNTTGGNSIRFNPNLYNCGKVCLSLLGTWSGDESEKWNPKNSTFLQVLVSIQSLILVEQPFFNEPGYEKYMNQKEGTERSQRYNEPLLIGTIKWAINDMIINPPIGMEDVIRTHFKLKKNEIIATTQKWYDMITPTNKEALSIVRGEMIQLLDKL